MKGSLKLMQEFKEAVFIFIVPPSIQVLEKRLRQRRSESDDILSRRLKNAIKEVTAYFHYDYIVINDALEDAIAGLTAIITAEHLKANRDGVQLMMMKWLEVKDRKSVV